MSRTIIERSTPVRRRSEHRWAELLDLGGESVRISYRDNGSRMARVPWITYRAVGTLAGTAVDIDGPYVAEPNWWRRDRSDLAPGVEATSDGRRRFVIESSDERFTLRTGSRFGSVLESDGVTLAEFPFGCGMFDLATERLSVTSSVVVASVVGSGIYRMVARGRVLDSALLNTASPFRKQAFRRSDASVARAR